MINLTELFDLKLKLRYLMTNYIENLKSTMKSFSMIELNFSNKVDKNNLDLLLQKSKLFLKNLVY